MDFSKKHQVLLYLEKNKALFFVEGSDAPVEMSLPKRVINNLEVIDKSVFEQHVTTFLTEQHIKPTSVFIILGKDVTFDKVLENIPLSLQVAETEKFLEMIPLSHILTKTYTFSKKIIIVATNKAYCEDFIAALGENQLHVAGIIPLAILEEKLPQMKGNFDEKLALKKIESLKQLFLPIGYDQQEKLFTYEVPSLKNTQFVVLIIIFSLLLVILGIQVYTQIIAPSGHTAQVKPGVKKTYPSPVASPSATMTPQPTSEE